MMNSRRSIGYNPVSNRERARTRSRSPGPLMTRMDSVPKNMSLSYNNLLMNSDGSVLSIDNIRDLRERYGYCITCNGEPVRLFEVKKSKLNPLWKSKEPLTTANECLNGVCLRCNPEVDPRAMVRRTSYRATSMRAAARSMSMPAVARGLQTGGPGSTSNLKTASERSLQSSSGRESSRAISYQPNPHRGRPATPRGRSTDALQSMRKDNSQQQLSSAIRQNSLSLSELAEEAPDRNSKVHNSVSSRSGSPDTPSPTGYSPQPTAQPTTNGLVSELNKGSSMTSASTSQPDATTTPDPEPAEFAEASNIEPEIAAALAALEAEEASSPNSVFEALPTPTETETKVDDEGDEDELEADSSHNRPKLMPAFSNPDFSEGTEAFKSHRKKKKKSSKKKKNKVSSVGKSKLSPTPTPDKILKASSTLDENDFPEFQTRGAFSRGISLLSSVSDDDVNTTDKNVDTKVAAPKESHRLSGKDKSQSQKQKKKGKNIWGEEADTLDDFVSASKPKRKSKAEKAWPPPPSLAIPSEPDSIEQLKDTIAMLDTASPGPMGSLSPTPMAAPRFGPPSRQTSMEPGFAGSMQAGAPRFGPPSRQTSIEPTNSSLPPMQPLPLDRMHQAFGASLGPLGSPTVNGVNEPSPFDSPSKRNMDRPSGSQPAMFDGMGFPPRAERNNPGQPRRTNSGESYGYNSFSRPMRVDSQASGRSMSSGESHGYGTPSRNNSTDPSSYGPSSRVSSISTDSYRFSPMSRNPSLQRTDEVPSALGAVDFGDSFSSFSFPSQVQHEPEQSKMDVEAKVEEVTELLKDVSAAGDISFTAELLANTVRSNQSISKIQELCFSHVWELSKFNDENKVHFMQMGLAVDIVKSMKIHRKSVEVQEQACGCLWSLSVNQFNRVELVRAGAVKAVVRAVEDHIQNEKFLETAFGCLRTLSPDAEVRQAIKQLLGTQRVCRAMSLHRNSTPLQRDGCAFLSNVAVDMDNQVVFRVAEEELEAVVRALGDHLRNETVVSSAVFALKNYTYEENNLRALRYFEDLMSLLEDAARYSSKQEIRSDANEVLENLRLLREEDEVLEEIAFGSLEEALNSPKLTPAGAVTNIRDVLKDYEWSEKLLCYGLDSLMSLGHRGHDWMKHIIEHDLLKAIVSAMQKQEQNPRVQERACVLIKQLAEHSKRSRSIICDTEGLTAVVTALRKHRGVDRVQLPAYGAIQEMAQDTRCNQFIERHGGLQQLQNALNVE